MIDLLEASRLEDVGLEEDESGQELVQLDWRRIGPPVAGRTLRSAARGSSRRQWMLCPRLDPSSDTSTLAAYQSSLPPILLVAYEEPTFVGTFH